MTTQEAYEQMRIYLTRPGAKRAYHDELQGCGYEMTIEEETHRCAVGCLLSPAAIDELERNDSLFGVGIDNLYGCFELPRQELDGVSLAFLGNAQSVHDDHRSWRGGKFDVLKLDAVADAHKLTVVVDEPQGAPQPVVEREAVLV